MRSTYFRGVIILTALFLLNGCLAVPLIDSVSQSGVRKSDRVAMLPKAIGKFHEALQWGNRAEAMQYVVAEQQTSVINSFDTGNDEEEKVVSSKVKSVDFSEDAYDAQVKVEVRSYIAPFYVVKTRLEKQEWKFGTRSGWQLFSREVTKKKA